MAVPKFMRVIRKTMDAVALFAVVGITLLLGSLWLDHTRKTMLPATTGLFAVGRATYVWSEAAQLDSTAPQTGRSIQEIEHVH